MYDLMNFPSALERQNMCFAGGCKNQTKGMEQSSSAGTSGDLLGAALVCLRLCAQPRRR